MPYQDPFSGPPTDNVNISVSESMRAFNVKAAQKTMNPLTHRDYTEHMQARQRHVAATHGPQSHLVREGVEDAIYQLPVDERGAKAGSGGVNSPLFSGQAARDSQRQDALLRNGGMRAPGNETKASYQAQSFEQLFSESMNQPRCFASPQANISHSSSAREPSQPASATGSANANTNWLQPNEIFFDNAHGARINTEIYIYQILKNAHPDVEILDTDPYDVDILTYISATGQGTVTHLQTSTGPAPSSLTQTIYLPPGRRLDGGKGQLVQNVLFGKYLVEWQSHQFLVYIVDSRDGTYPVILKRQFILTSDVAAANTLLISAGSWSNDLHGEIWVYDQGFWNKDAALWNTIQKSHWEDIILPEALKEDLLETVFRFYDSRDTYQKLRVPWKRGLIFYGPPGNGKTVSIKATMKSLYDRKVPVPTLYVKSLASWAGPEYSINEIFNKARREAPCYLVFEDLDSLVTDAVRSFFLNAVDGLGENEGILMVGSTNHLERLDPGIAKRPSRFDRKYLFNDPSEDERRQYCQYWQKKLSDNKDIEFPDKLLSPMAKLMSGFSFAYMQEAFVSTLLKIASEDERDGKSGDEVDLDEWLDGLDIHAETAWDVVDDCVPKKDGLARSARKDHDESDLNKYRLWRELKAQVKNLKDELDKDRIV